MKVRAHVVHTVKVKPKVNTGELLKAATEVNKQITADIEKKIIKPLGPNDLQNKLVANEYGFARDSSIPTVADIKEEHTQNLEQLKRTVRFLLRIKFK